MHELSEKIRKAYFEQFVERADSMRWFTFDFGIDIGVSSLPQHLKLWRFQNVRFGAFIALIHAAFLEAGRNVTRPSAIQLVKCSNS